MLQSVSPWFAFPDHSWIINDKRNYVNKHAEIEKRIVGTGSRFCFIHRTSQQYKEGKSDLRYVLFLSAAETLNPSQCIWQQKGGKRTWIRKRFQKNLHRLSVEFVPQLEGITRFDDWNGNFPIQYLNQHHHAQHRDAWAVPSELPDVHFLSPFSCYEATPREFCVGVDAVVRT